MAALLLLLIIVLIKVVYSKEQEYLPNTVLLAAGLFGQNYFDVYCNGICWRSRSFLLIF